MTIQAALIDHLAKDLLTEWFNTCGWRGGWETATEPQRETFRVQAKMAVKSAQAFKATRATTDSKTGPGMNNNLQDTVQ